MESYLPGQITQPNTPHDCDDQPISPNTIYRVWAPKGQPRRVLVTEDPSSGDLYVVPCNEGGKPLANSRPQRIDETSAALIWDRVGVATQC